MVAEALMGAMASIAGPAWSAEYESAWRGAFAVVAGAMLEGAEGASVAAAA